ncbi:MAG: cation:proton antiporter subunit C [Acidobacteria bacterium]|nr:cation:proton antiporter subunit C [Acidobacteriota bacterium]
MTLTPALLYALAGCALFAIGLHALVVQPHLLRKILGLNVSGGGVFLVLVAIAHRGPGAAPDPVPHAMVLTGIVVAVCGTAVALVLAGRVHRATGTMEPGSSPAEAREP